MVQIVLHLPLYVIQNALMTPKCVFQEPAVGCVAEDSCHTGLQHHPCPCPSGQCCRQKDSCHVHSEPLEEGHTCTTDQFHFETPIICRNMTGQAIKIKTMLEKIRTYRFVIAHIHCCTIHNATISTAAILLTLLHILFLFFFKCAPWPELAVLFFHFSRENDKVSFIIT